MARTPPQRKPMKATKVEFRLRVLIILALYVLCFWAPWAWTRGSFAPPVSTAWLALSTTLGRWPALGVAGATLLVTWVAIACAAAATVLRIWGTAWLGASIVQSGAMHGERVMVAGPYRYVRNPLYLGSWFFGASVSILMPPTGAVVFLVLLGLFYFRLILGEEAFLATQLGERYLEYRRQVPRLLPRLRPEIAASASQPQWFLGTMAEILPLGYTLCLAVLAWRYEPRLLGQCLLVCFGLSLVMRALLPKNAAGGA